MSVQERMRNYRQRKKQQAILIASILDAKDQQLSWAIHSSRARTRLYHQRQRQRVGYQKDQWLRDREHSRRFYAKKQHVEVRQQASQLASCHSTAQDVSPNQQIDLVSLPQEVFWEKKPIVIGHVLRAAQKDSRRRFWNLLYEDWENKWNEMGKSRHSVEYDYNLIGQHSFIRLSSCS